MTTITQHLAERQAALDAAAALLDAWPGTGVIAWAEHHGGERVQFTTDHLRALLAAAMGGPGANTNSPILATVDGATYGANALVIASAWKGRFPVVGIHQGWVETHDADGAVQFVPSHRIHRVDFPARGGDGA